MMEQEKTSKIKEEGGKWTPAFHNMFFFSSLKTNIWDLLSVYSNKSIIF